MTCTCYCSTGGMRRRALLACNSRGLRASCEWSVLVATRNSANSPWLPALLAWSRGRADYYHWDYARCGGMNCLSMSVVMPIVYAGVSGAATTDADGSKLPEGKPEEQLPEWCSEEFKAWWWRNCAWVTSAGYEGDEIPTLYQAYEVCCLTGLYLCAATFRVTHVLMGGGVWL